MSRYMLNWSYPFQNNKSHWDENKWNRRRQHWRSIWKINLKRKYDKRRWNDSCLFNAWLRNYVLECVDWWRQWNCWCFMVCSWRFFYINIPLSTSLNNETFYRKDLVIIDNMVQFMEDNFLRINISRLATQSAYYNSKFLRSITSCACVVDVSLWCFSFWSLLSQ